MIDSTSQETKEFDATIVHDAASTSSGNIVTSEMGFFLRLLIQEPFMLQMTAFVVHRDVYKSA